MCVNARKEAMDTVMRAESGDREGKERCWSPLTVADSTRTRVDECIIERRPRRHSEHQRRHRATDADNRSPWPPRLHHEFPAPRRNRRNGRHALPRPRCRHRHSQCWYTTRAALLIKTLSVK